MIIAGLVLLGLVLGSFVNALVWRFHEQAELKDAVARKTKTKHKLSAQELSMSQGRSMCSNCHHELAPKDLVPLLSWLYLRGKCRYCRKPIQDSPLIEAVLPILFVISYLAWSKPLQGVNLYEFIFWLVFLVAFMALAVYDLRWFLLPDRIVFPLIGLAAVELLGKIIFFAADWQILIGAGVGVLVASGIFYVLYQLSDGAWIGGGDVKLGIVLGLLVASGLQALLLLFVASLLGTLVALPMLLAGKAARNLRIPFGPYLLAATFIVVLYGHGIIDAYARIVGLTS